MAEATRRLSGPAFLTNSNADVYLVAAGFYVVVYHLHLVNTHTSDITVELFVDATGTATAGKEIAKTHNIVTKTEWDVYFPRGLRLAAAEAIVGSGSTTNKVTITVMGDKFAV